MHKGKYCGKSKQTNKRTNQETKKQRIKHNKNSNVKENNKKQKDHKREGIVVSTDWGCGHTQQGVFEVGHGLGVGVS